MIAAVLPAAGLGSRFKSLPSDQAKQFVLLCGKPVYLWSLEVLAKHPQIDKIALVVPPETAPDFTSNLKTHIDQVALAKISVVGGGATRQDSVRHGLESLAQQDIQPQYVMVHDAARPFLNTQMISDVIRSLTMHGACSLAVSVTDTIKRTSDGVMKETLDRDELTMVQTPQAARFDWMLAAHRMAVENSFSATDDSSILQHAGREVHIVPGTRYNLKITSREDLAICEFLATRLESGFSKS
ncbi:MAG TPA: 2-C-methyl-D-erythritol 4-phosphate cytidylyltransferase [Chroococcales cyanobacterium]